MPEDRPQLVMQACVVQLLGLGSDEQSPFVMTTEQLNQHMSMARGMESQQPAEACSEILHLYYMAIRVSPDAAQHLVSISGGGKSQGPWLHARPVPCPSCKACTLSSLSVFLMHHATMQIDMRHGMVLQQRCQPCHLPAMGKQTRDLDRALVQAVCT